MEEKTLRQIQENFVQELKDADSGKQTSLAYIINDLPHSPLVADGEIFQVITIGGSVFRKALLKKDGAHLSLLSREDKDQPVFRTEEDLFQVLEKELDPTIRVLAMNFAYPLKPVFSEGRLDGILLRGSKENEFAGLVDKPLGKTIESHFKEKFHRDIIVSAANDTVSLLLSGLTEVATHDIAGGIVGTGMNFAFFLNESQVVNLEAAYFDKFPQTEEGKAIDAASVTPGTALYEKETSGAYLYKHFNEILKTRGLAYPPITSTFELDRLLENPETDEAKIAKMLMERSSCLVAALIAGITAFKDKDMVFVMEGSLFWHGRGYIETVKRCVQTLIPEHTVTFMKIEDSPIFGAAKLVS